MDDNNANISRELQSMFKRPIRIKTHVRPMSGSKVFKKIYSREKFGKLPRPRFGANISRAPQSMLKRPIKIKAHVRNHVEIKSS